MKPKVIIPILASIAVVVPSPIFAFSWSPNNSLSVEIARTNIINNLIKRINLLYQVTEKYMLQTGDMNPTIDKIDTLYNISKDTWLNYDKTGYMKISVIRSKTQNAIIITNILSPKEANIANYIQNSRRLNAFGFVNIIKEKESDGTEKIVKINIEFPFSPVLASFIKAINTIPKKYPNGIISYTIPTDTTKSVWFKPDGNGNFIVYQKNGKNQWNITGVYVPGEGLLPAKNNTANSIAPETGEKVRLLIRVDNISILENKFFPKGSLATDIHGNMYVTDGKGKWYLLGKKQ